MSVFPRRVWADPIDLPRPERRHAGHATVNVAVTIDRRVTTAGYVEVTGNP